MMESVSSFSEWYAQLSLSEENFLLLNCGPDAQPVFYSGKKWESGPVEKIPEGDIVLALAYELNTAFENIQCGSDKGMDVPSIMWMHPATTIALPPLGDFLVPAIEKQKRINFHGRISKEEYLQSVLSLQEHIRKGDIYEVNFCMEFFAEEVEVDPFVVFANLHSITRAPFSAFLRREEQFLLCGSPERFVQRKGDRLLSQPIKGTIRRGKSQEEDKVLREQLRNDSKERSENVMIVDLVRNDLSRIAIRSSVRVDELMEVYTFPTVHQMISTISCELREGVNTYDILKAAFPMGSMTGAPKVKAMELIARYEQSRRGWYSGSVGFRKANGDCDLNVVIRSLFYDRQKRYLSFSVGSAITAASDPEREYDECLLKAEAMIKAVNASS
ncbi:MAG TPA: aminodeoxychorismate synthase component I [Flavobacteriales bacterium]|nr:aminodeoxychorismate synthase component I [Flavobacteriales bacterium]HCA82486.1 aminodeoxychorismate synthase component I [Flavobacteriales bacterium]HRE73877.1 anthranilate synthase component I family protein [Flavobacteriales bacterium]HRE98130.1 anthranilate synthase component I family protein [Flavobacteriales bacterium]HRJ35056.1 anthranilate synthase component I family protein [Flavobacteriales bacterium]